MNGKRKKQIDLLRLSVFFAIYLIISIPFNVYNVSADSQNPPPVVDDLESKALSPTSVYINWTEFSIEDVPDISGYRVYRDFTQLVGEVTEGEFTDSGLSANTLYKYDVAPLDNFGNEGPKRRIEVTTPPPDTSTPEMFDFSFSSLGSSVLFEFKSGRPTNATIFYGTDEWDEEYFSRESKVTEHSLQLDGLDSSQYYRYRIRLCAEYGSCYLSQERLFRPGVDNTPPTLNIDIPSISREQFIDIEGETEPYSSIVVASEATSNLLSANANSAGLFSVSNVVLLPSGDTRLEVNVTDMGGNEISREFRVSIDQRPPELSVDEVPETSEDNRITVSGTVSEAVKLKIFVFLDEEDTTPPDQVSGFNAVIEGDQVHLTWDELQDTIHSYNVYRNGVLIDTASPSNTEYFDRRANSSTTYSYRVSAVDTGCNEGPKSVSESLTMPSGTRRFDVAPHTQSCEVTPSVDEDIPVGSFSKTVSLQSGDNVVKVVVTDMAGHETEETFMVYYDNENPRIIETNLRDLSPTYVDKVTIEGKVNEPADIEIILNEGTSYEKDYTTEASSTDEEGNYLFSQEVRLSRIMASEGSSGSDGGASASLSRGGEWMNSVKIIATDRVDKTATETGDIKYAFCGEGGTDWDIDIGQSMPAEIVPRLLLEGFASFGFTVELDYLGPTDASGEHPDVVSVVPGMMPVNVLDAEKFDKDWVAEGYPRFIASNNDNTKGYVKINFKAVDNLIEWPEDDMSLVEKENYLAENHEGECFGVERTLGVSHGNIDIANIGCVKIPLVLTINYGRDEDNRGGTQKVCIDASVMITPRVDIGNNIPDELLNRLIGFLDEAMNAIEEVKPAVESATKWALYGCLGSWVVWFFTKANEWLSCGFTMKLEDFSFSEEGQFLGETGEDMASDPQQCFDAKKASFELWNVLKWTCDRVMCPSVPSFNKYVGDNEGNKDSFCSQYLREEKMFPEDSSSEEMKKDEVNFDSLKKTLALTKDASGEPWSEKMTEWCEEEFFYEWQPSCIFLDPYEESFCSYAKKYGADDRMKTRFDTECGFGFQFRDILDNSFGCQYNELDEVAWEIAPGDWISAPPEDVTSDGTVPGTGVEHRKAAQILDGVMANCGSRTDDRQKAECYDSRYDTLAQDVDPEAMDPGFVESISSCRSKEDHTDKTRCYEDVLEDARRGLEDNINSGDAVVPSGNYWIWVKRYDDNPSDIWISKARREVKVSGGYISDPGTKLQQEEEVSISNCDCGDCNTCIEEGSCEYTSNQFGRILFDKRVIDELCIGGAVDDYVINPTSGVRNALRCGCLSSINSYLTQYYNAMNLIKACFESILLTGDGSGGVCQQALTMYVCDLIYEAIECVTKYAAGGGGAGTDEIEDDNFFALVSAAANDVSQGVTNRYGDSNLYQVLFQERALVHSTCIFFFTGTWPLDIDDVIGETVTAIDPIVGGLANRRYQSYDPNTGYATYLYTLSPFIVPGASDFSYDIDLVCTTGDNCEDGPCDCFHLGEERTLRVTSKFGSGRLGSSDTLDTQQFVVVDAVEDPTNEGKLRYDRMRISWSYTDNDGRDIQESKDFMIREKGGSPPASCEFDVVANEFRCEVFVDELGETRFVDGPSGDNTVVYYNEEVTVDPFQVYKKSPDEDNPLTKFLKISVYTDNERAVNWNKDEGVNYKYKRISAEGYTDVREPRFRLTENLLRIEKVEGVACEQREQNSLMLTEYECGDATKVIAMDGNRDVWYIEGTYDPTGSPGRYGNIHGKFSSNFHFKRCGEGADLGNSKRFTCGGSDILIRNYEDYNLPGGYITEEMSLDDIDFEGANIFDYPHLILYRYEADPGSASQFTCPQYLEVRYELFHASEQNPDQPSENIVRWNGASQSKSVNVPIECTESQDTGDDVDEDDECMDGLTNLDAEPCECGDEMCGYDEKCCLDPRLEGSLGAGYCFAPDDTVKNCDREEPRIRSLEIDATSQDRLEFTFDIIEQGFGNQKMSPGLYGSLALYDGEDFGCEEFSVSAGNFASATPSRIIRPQIVTNGNTIRTYTDNVQLLMKDEYEGKRFFVKILLYDEAGNVANSYPLFVRVTGSGYEFNTNSEGKDIFEFNPDSSLSDAEIEEPSCPN